MRRTDGVLGCLAAYVSTTSTNTCGFKQRQTGRLQSADWRDRLSDVWRVSHPGGVIVWVITGIITPNQPAAVKTAGWLGVILPVITQTISYCTYVHTWHLL